MIDEHSPKDEIYLKNVEKIGNSVNNICYLENILSQSEHEVILNFVKNRELWTHQPWDAKSIVYDEIPKEIADMLEKVFQITYKEIKNIYGVEINSVSRNNINILKFEKEFVLYPHIDILSNESNHIASIYYINDDYEGGEIVFPDFNLKIKPKPNSIIFFPGNENYWHEVLEIIENNRYSSSMWFQFTGSKFNQKKEWYPHL